MLILSALLPLENHLHSSYIQLGQTIKGNGLMALTPYWALKLTLYESNSPLNLQQQKDECWLSPSLRACGMNKLAHLDSLELAKSFLAYAKPKLDKRYKGAYEVSICECGISSRDKARIDKDSDAVRALVSEQE